jgi:Zn-dependent protease
MVGSSRAVASYFNARYRPRRFKKRDPPVPDAIRFCAHCGTELPANALGCSVCGWLAHSAEAEELARRARACETAGDYPASVELLRQALALLPPESGPAASLRSRIATLGGILQSPATGVQATPQVPPALASPSGQSSSGQASSGQPASGQSWAKRLGPLGVLLAFLSKAKFLLLGFSKLGTLLSMFASFALYWSYYGWKFAAGFILGIYVHEMGHIWSLRQFGLRASAPMFIPGFGAFVSLYDSPANVGQDARIGLAGPLWGAGAAIACLIPGFAAGSPLWLAVAHATAYINLFNLIPVWQLDGGRGFRALDFTERVALLVLMAILWWTTSEGLFLFLMAGAAYRIFWNKDQPPQGDRGVAVQYAGLLLLFGVMLKVAK